MSISETAEFGAVRHLLASPSIAARTEPFICDGDIDWGAVFAQTGTMSNGEQVLVRAAHDLWEAQGEVGIWEITQGLDATNFRRFVEALAISRGETVDREPVAA